MDHDNNRVGRRIAIEAGPGVSSEELGGRVEQAAREGRLVVVGRDGLTLEFTDQITPAEVSGARPFRRPLPGQPQPPW